MIDQKKISRKKHRDKKMENTWKRISETENAMMRSDIGFRNPRRAEIGQGNIWRGNDWECPRTEERHQPIDSRSPANIKQNKKKKKKEIHT